MRENIKGNSLIRSTFVPHPQSNSHPARSVRNTLSETLDFDFTNFSDQEKEEYQANVDLAERFIAMRSLTEQSRDQMRNSLASLSSGYSSPDDQPEDGVPPVSVTDAENLLDIFGPERIRRYFGHLSGPSKDLPYAMILPIHDSDLESYLLFELCKDFPRYQDQCVLDYVSDPVERVGINLLISRLKSNPDFLLRLNKEPRIYQPDRPSYIHRFMRHIERDFGFNPSHRVLEYLIMDPKRQRLATSALRLSDARKKLRRADEFFLEPYFQE